MRITKKASGSQVVAKSAAWCNQFPTILSVSSAGGRESLSRVSESPPRRWRTRRRGRARRPRTRRFGPRRGRGRRPRRSVTRRPRWRKPRIAASSQTSVATPKTTISSGSSAARSGSVFGFVKTSKLFFRSRISRRPSIIPGTSPGGNGSERERQRVALLRLEDLLGAARAAQAVRRIRVAEVGRRRRSPGRSARGRRRRRRGRAAPRGPRRRARSIAGATSFAPGT